jgi:hypothetical protein
VVLSNIVAVRRKADEISQNCRGVNQLTICGDTIDQFPANFNSGGFRLRGNLKIGPKDDPTLV